MPTNPDWYPQSQEALPGWWANLFDQLKNHGMQAKYGISGPDMDRCNTIAQWFGYWVPRRQAEDTYSQAGTKYFKAIAGRDQSVPPPDQPDPPATGGEPTQPVPGSEGLARNIAGFIKANKAVYSTADGEAMGIVAPEAEAPNVDDMKPDFTGETRVAYGVGVKFRKKGMDGQRFEYRHVGDPTWLPGGTLLESGFFTVAPKTPGESEQIEVRSRYIDGNESVGQYSDIKQVFIAP